jgi:hypothetical protein
VRAVATILASLLAVLIGAGRWLTRAASHTRPLNAPATQPARLNSLSRGTSFASR